jgi:hypothetical protein
LQAFSTLADARVRVDDDAYGEFKSVYKAFYQERWAFGRLERSCALHSRLLPAGLFPLIGLVMFPFTDFLCRPIFVKLSGGLLDVDGLGCGTGQAGRSLRQLVAVLQRPADRLRDLLTLEDYNPPQFVGSRSGIGISWTS